MTGRGTTAAPHVPVLLDDQRIPEDLKDIARFRMEERGTAQ